MSYTQKHPVLTAIVLFFITFLLRTLDIFIFQFDELFGELIVSKSLGFLLIALYLFLSGQSFSRIGLYAHDSVNYLIAGFLFTTIIFTLSYWIEYAVLFDQKPYLVFSPLDPKQSVTGGISFAFFLLFGNLINALMEEGLFRGMFIPALLTRYAFWKANLIQATFFGIWHLVWPVKSYFGNQHDFFETMVIGSFLFLGSTLMGIVWGYLFYKTRNLWIVVSAHFTANSIFNFVHIASTEGFNNMIMVRNIVSTTMSLFLMTAFIYFAQKKNLLPHPDKPFSQ